MPDGDLYLEPFHGYRVWFPRYGMGDVVEGLGSITFTRHRWPAGGNWLRAMCPYGCELAPARGCSCGVWGYTHPGGLRRHGFGVVKGEVEAMGHIVRHTGGWRAQLARVVAIHDPGEGARRDVREASRDAARLYEVPFVRLPEEPARELASIP